MSKLNLEPQTVFGFFEQMSEIPRGSGNTQAISDWCVAFAKQRNLAYVQDKLGNIIIFKDGTPGYEKAEPIILQGHLDMVCEAVPGSTKDMEKEGLTLVVDGDELHADGTTLGGDDGIAVAMALAVHFSHDRSKGLTLLFLVLTVALGSAFLAVKGFEYHKDITERLVPGPGFPLPDPASQIFFGFYWGMTALHALHMTAGLCVVGWLGWQAWTRRRALRSPAYEVVALYWHLVDIVWVFLYPLFYLGGRS